MLKRSFILLLMILSYVGYTQDSIVILEVNFDLDRFNLPTKEKARIDSLLESTSLDWVKKVEIFGHTDSLAGLDYNRVLSKNRVSSSLKYLVYKGLDPLKVKTDFYGEEKPKYNNSPQTRHLNRRVEIWFYLELASIPEPEQKLSEIELKTGDKIQIPNLNFVGNQAIPMWESFSVLEELLLLMKRNPELEIELQGHVCCTDNIELSEQRAFTVREFLRINGIDKQRISHKGFSNKRPLVKEKTDEDRAKNRRVEVLVVKNSDRRITIDELEEEPNLKVRVNDLKFFPKKGKLYPSGDFMLGLITDMLKASKGINYEFVVYDNINDKRVTSQRVTTIKREITSARVKKGTWSVRQAPKPQRMPESEGSNYIVLEIKKQG